jgi:hypothetical protein
MVRAGLMEKIMSKTTLRNVNASVEVREPKHELNEAELGTISGGTWLEELAKALGEVMNAKALATKGLR